MSNHNVTKVYIQSNPFTKENEIKINGSIVNFDCTYNKNTNEWSNVIFYKIHDYINGIKNIEITFNGIITDYEDIIDSANSASTYLNFKIHSAKHIPTRTAEERLTQVKTLVSDLSKNKAIKEFQSEGFTTRFDDILTPDFAVHVLATVSAGKSTLINAMVGKDLLPAKNQACTATMIAIRDCQDAGSTFTGKARAADHTLLATSENLTRKDVEDWNQTPEVTHIDIWGDISRVKPSNHISLILVDTPGPNNSQNLEHRKTTFKSIEEAEMSLVLYVMNATQLGVDDDKTLLKRICKVINEGGRATRDRFLFVLNKIDQVDPDKEPVEQILENARIYLDDIGIKNARIIPIAAQTTKLARMAKAGHPLDRREQGHLRLEESNLLEEWESRIFNHLEVSASVRETLKTAWAEAGAAGDTLSQIEIFGGVPVIEAVIAEHMEKYAHVHKVADAYTALKERYDNIYQREITAIETTIGQSDDDLKKLNQNIESLQSILKNADFKNKIINEINKKKEIPESIETKVRDCRKNAQNVIYNLEQKMKGTVSPSTASKTLSAAREEINNFAADLCNFLETQFESIQEAQFLDYKNIYDENISDIIKYADKDSHFSLEMRKSLSIKRIDNSIDQDIIKKYTKTVTKKTGNPNKAWYKPWTWGDDKFKITTKDTVDLSEVYNKEILPSREWFDSTIENSKNEIRNISSQLKNRFIHSFIPKAEKAISDYLVTLDNHTKSRDAINEAMTVAKSKKKDLEDIKDRIECVASL